MMGIILGCAAVIYLLIALHCLTVWTAVFRRDTSVSQDEELGAIVILVLISILWPIVVPLAYRELFLKAQKTFETASSVSQ